jgi:hypothetical protein
MTRKATLGGQPYRVGICGEAVGNGLARSGPASIATRWSEQHPQQGEHHRRSGAPRSNQPLARVRGARLLALVVRDRVATARGSRGR